MPEPRTTADFLHVLRKSRLIDDERLDNYEQSLNGQLQASPRKLVKRMIDDGLITHLQSALLLKGKWKNFVINGKYKLLEHIGTGGMGQVFLCEHIKMGRRVAIKILPNARADDPTSLKRFYREAQAVAAVNHPNIVRAHDIDHDGSVHFLVMEYVEGRNLQDVVKKRGPLDVGRATEYIVQATCGLQHAHEAGLIHRDVKPSNLILDRSGQVRLMDLGLARFFHDSDPLTQQIPGRNFIGTADYLAPEQATSSHAADARSDLYSLGATFYFLLAGHGPFKDGDIATKLELHRKGRITPIRKLRPEVPHEVAAVIEKALLKDPNARYQSCLELIDALSPLVPLEVPAPDAEEMPKLCLAARSSDSPSGRTVAPERSGSRSRPSSALPSIKAKSKPRMVLTKQVVMAIVLIGGAAILGGAIGKSILAMRGQ